jgi:hypothetical protein
MGVTNLACVEKCCHNQNEGVYFPTSVAVANFQTFLDNDVPSNYLWEVKAKALEGQTEIRRVIETQPNLNLTSMVLQSLPNPGVPVSPVKQPERMALMSAEDANLSDSFNTVLDAASLDFETCVGSVASNPCEVAALKKTYLELKDIMYWGKGEKIYAAGWSMMRSERFVEVMNHHLHSYGAKCRPELKQYAACKSRAKFQNWLSDSHCKSKSA